MTPNPKSDQEKVVSDCGCQGQSDSDNAGAGSLSGRRRLLRAGVSAGSVLLALSGKSALGCTTDSACRFPSTWASLTPAAGGNVAGASHAPDTDPHCSLGRSPGFWRQAQKRCYWPRGAGPVPDSLPCSYTHTTGAGPDICGAYLGDGTKVNSVFGGAVLGKDADKVSMQQLLCSGSGTDAWHYCAAYLNAWTVLNYPLKPQDVVDMWNSRFKVGNTVWSRALGRQFIESTYDSVNDGADPIFKVGCVPVPCKGK